jgi:hypothetical protein
MNTLATLQALVTALNSAEDVITKFRALRDFCTDEQWDEFTAAGPLGDLLDSLADLECDLDQA